MSELHDDGVRAVASALDYLVDVGADFGPRTQAGVAFDAVIGFLVARKEDWLTNVRPGLPISDNVDRLLGALLQTPLHSDDAELRGDIRNINDQ